MPRNKRRKRREYKLFKIKPEYLEQMRKPGGRVIDVRVPDPQDIEKRYNELTRGDFLHFMDTNREVLKVLVEYVAHYPSAEKLLKKEGINRVWPQAKTLEQAIALCLQFPGYAERIKQHGIYALKFEKLIVYVAGPYSAKTKEQQEKNIKIATSFGEKIMHLGYLPFVPHTALQGWENFKDMDYNNVLNICFEWIRKADIFFKIAASPGADKEEELARELNIPIFKSLDDLRFWKPQK